MQIVRDIAYVRRVKRRNILLLSQIILNPPPAPVVSFRTLQFPALRYPPLRYPKRRKPIYTLRLAVAPLSVLVPNIVGLTEPAAVSALSGAFLNPGIETTAYSAVYAVGLTISQSPTAGNSVALGTSVNFVESLGPAPVAVNVPNVVGQLQSIAASILTATGFTVTTTTAYTAGATLGTVTSQTPAAGTPEFLPFTITIVIAVSQAWPPASTITNLPVRGAWELPGRQQSLWVVGSGCFLMTVATAATSTAQATFTLARVGTLLSSTGPVCIRDNGVGGTAVLVDGSYGYYYTFTSVGGTVGAFTQITDPNFLGSDRVAFIDGWWVFNQPGTQVFYTPVSTYSLKFTGSSFALKDGATDLLVTLHENKEELWLIGAKTTEVWYDAGGTYFPFQRLVSTMLQVGCSAKHSIARLNAQNEDGLIWLGNSERGQNVVIKITGFTATVVSTPAVNDDIAQLTIVSDAIGYTYQEDGHEFYVLTFPSAQNKYGGIGTTWVYDASVGPDLGWSQRLGFEPYSGLWYRHRSNCFLNFQNQRLVGDFQNGSIYRLDRTVYTDNGWPLVAWRRAPHIWDGAARERVFMASLQIELRPGVGLSSGSGVDPQAVLTISRDSGTTFGQELRRAMGKIGNYLNRVIWRRLSFSRDAVVDLKIYDPVNRDIVGTTLKKGENG